MILAAVACPVFTSCYDDSELVGRVENLEERVTNLEAKLNTELQALQTLLEGKINALAGEVEALVTVSKCEKQTDGSYKLTLSDGSSFTVYPEYTPDHNGLVTTTEIEGVLYWAIFEDGSPVAVTDSKGNLVPVVDVVPQVKVDAETGLVEISFDGGESWVAVGYNTPSIFADAEVVETDNYTDEEEAEDPDWCQETPMYVVLTLADGSTITVTIDGAATFMFASNYGGMIKTQYISEGNTTTLSVQAVNVTDWIKEVPAGWTVEENLEWLADYGQAEFYVTAPSAEAIASGAAVAEGTLKVLAVAEGGKSITASVLLTTKPFTNIAAGKGNLTVAMNNGLSGYLVGVSSAADFDPEAILAELEPVVEYVPDPNDWSDYGWSPWYVEENATPLDDNYFSSSIEDYAIADLKGIPELVEGEQYVVWAIGLDSWMDNYTYESGYYLGSIVSVPYYHAFINMKEEIVTFNDIKITAEFVGVEAFFGGFSMKYSDGDMVEDILYELNSSLNSSWGAPYPLYVNDEYIAGWDNGTYTGDPNTLVDGWQSIGPDETYYLYLIPYVEGKTAYTAADVYYYEWTTEPLMPGGTLAVTAGEPTLDYKTITVPIEATGAVYLYHAYVNPELVSTIADKQAYLLENGTMTKGDYKNAQMYNLSPGVTKTLLAMAVDQYGCYGDVFQQDYTTKTYEYASATVSAELVGTPSQTGYVKFSCTGDVDTYYYWYGTQDHYQWTGSSYFGGTAESASSFIALNSSYYFIKNVTATALPEGGVEMTGLTIGTPSLICVSAKLTDGTFTMATVVNFTPSMDLGNFVYALDDNGNENAAWLAAKPVVTASVETVGDFNIVSWTVDLPEGFNAITSCFSSDYLMDYPSAKSKAEFMLSYEYIERNEVIDGGEYSYPYASKGYNIYTLVWDADGNYYEVYVHELDIQGGWGV